jgi:hypothetical protein
MTKNVYATELICRLLKRVTLGLLVITGVGAVAIFGLLYWQGAQTTDKSGEYVALGSSFAAGIGLGPRVPDSPIQCLRTAGGYPSLVFWFNDKAYFVWRATSAWSAIGSNWTCNKTCYHHIGW